MHGGPYRIATQTQQQLEDFLIGLYADLSFHAFLKGLVTPRTYRPILIVDKDTTVLHTGILLSMVFGRQGKSLFLLGYDIAPPYPR